MLCPTITAAHFTPNNLDNLLASPRSSHETLSAFPYLCSTVLQTSPNFFVLSCAIGKGLTSSYFSATFSLKAFTFIKLSTNHIAASFSLFLPSNICPFFLGGGAKTLFTKVGDPLKPILSSSSFKSSLFHLTIFAL
jgi:hypothetical protein